MKDCDLSSDGPSCEYTKFKYKTEHKYGVVVMVGQKKHYEKEKEQKLKVACISCKLETGHVLKRAHVPTHKRGGGHKFEDRKQLSLSIP